MVIANAEVFCCFFAYTIIASETKYVHVFSCSDAADIGAKPCFPAEVAKKSMISR
jgi:hypothetical protein